MTKLVPEFIYFDLGNVLLKFSHRHACDQVAHVAGLPTERVRDFFTPEVSLNRLERGEISVTELHQEFCETFRSELAQPPSLHELTRAGSDIFCLNTPIVPLVAQLTVANVRMGILSNTSLPHWQFIANGQYRIVADFFDVLALSYEIGEMKPATSIYAQAAKLADVAPERIFFTDDRPENVEGAKQAGWQAFLFETVGQLAKDMRSCGLTFNY